MKCLDISGERWEVERVQGEKLGVGDLQGLVEMCASATNPCPGHKGNSYESIRIVVKKVDDIVHQFLRQVHVGLVKGLGNFGCEVRPICRHESTPR